MIRLMIVIALLFLLALWLRWVPQNTVEAHVAAEEVAGELSDSNENSEGQDNGRGIDVRFDLPPGPQEDDSAEELDRADAKEEPVEERPAEDEAQLDPGESSAGGSGVRVDATYRDAVRVIEALLDRGARLLLADADYRVLWQIDSSGTLQQPTAASLQGVPRRATREVTAFLGRPLPSPAAHGLVVWPEPLWRRVVGALSQDTQYARMELDVVQGRLHVRLEPMQPERLPIRRLEL